MDRVKNVDPEIERKFRPFTRTDKDKWARWKFYLGSLTLLPRVVAGVSVTIFLIGVLKILLIGTTPGKPFGQFRRKVMQFILFYWFRFILVSLARCKLTEIDHRSKEDKKQYPPTVVVNHTSWMDIWYLMTSPFAPSYLARDTIKNIPLIAPIANALQSLYVVRDDSGDRRSALQQVIDRQQVIYEKREFPQLCVFPEATTTNGTEHLVYEKGAFAAGLPVQPVVLKYPEAPMFHPQYTVISVLPHLFLMACGYHFELHAHFLPVYEPSPAEKKDWKLFAENVRTVITQAAEVPKSKLSYRDMNEYMKIL
eukprot:CAMPEP_0115040230 /NCGR_PEP_ID=MMETSP0216-20121206/44661_1 /TAXON_ID=223996 /ORGANISM="Protocruzia adherens, Strain Boccale" /LENGTH=309 /DNA_ID=CAMNT_0002421343 /DNA_START=89 /DNA_END=1014 /DNA_ORIENTATION=+